MNDHEFIEKVNTLLDEQEAADKFSGSVLVARGAQLILTAARGYAIHPNLLRNQPDTKFNIASVTKMFTAIVVMQLVAKGKLDLHVPVATYNPDLPHASEITIHQLLTLRHKRHGRPANIFTKFIIVDCHHVRSHAG